VGGGHLWGVGLYILLLSRRDLGIYEHLDIDILALITTLRDTSAKYANDGIDLAVLYDCLSFDSIFETGFFSRSLCLE
jgi:hypothetical protein